MRLTRLFRTASFRLTIGYTALLVLSAHVLGVANYLTTTGYLIESIDALASTEVDEVLSAARGGNLDDLAQTVDAAQAAHPEHDMLYLLQDANGRRLAGALGPTQPTEGMHSWSRNDPQRPQGAPYEFRGRGIKVMDGAYLFIGADAEALVRLRRSLSKTLGWGLLVTIGLGLAGGAVVSRAVIRRLEVINDVSNEIVERNLSERVPLRGTDDEFDHLSRNLNGLFDRIERLMRGMRQVSTDIAHDLRTPLTRLRQRLELAQQNGHDAGATHKALAASVRDVDTILETFSALLRVAEIDARARTAGFADVDLAVLVDTLVEDYTPVAEEQGRRISLAGFGPLPVHGDRALLTQMFANLLDNALRHTPAGTEITVSAISSGGVPVVEIGDRGPGIPVAEREKVFAPLYRLESSRNTPGTGMGLSIVAAIARQHQIQVSLSDNKPGLRIRLEWATDTLARADTASGNPVV